MSRIYISDLDGTLLGPDARLSDAARERLERLIDQGLLFTVASARGAVTIRETLGGLPLRLPYIAANGAYLIDDVNGRRRILDAIDSPLGRQIHHLVSGMGCPPFIAYWDGSTDRLDYLPDQINDGMRQFIEGRRASNDTRLRPVEAVAAAYSHQVISLSLINRLEILQQVHGALVERFDGRVRLHFYENMYNPQWHWLTIHPPGATKAAAIELLLAELNLRPEDLVVFGDHTNDVEMFRLAGRSVAVANAQPELLKLAGEVIGPHSEDSVVDYIEKDFLERARN
jgi:Cof subfamily protein (haloacid dehalogenase superfamily)